MLDELYSIRLSGHQEWAHKILMLCGRNLKVNFMWKNAAVPPLIVQNLCAKISRISNEPLFIVKARIKIQKKIESETRLI